MLASGEVITAVLALQTTIITATVVAAPLDTKYIIQQVMVATRLAQTLLTAPTTQFLSLATTTPNVTASVATIGRTQNVPHVQETFCNHQIVKLALLVSRVLLSALSLALTRRIATVTLRQ